jgi:hypothetical protein
VNARGIRPAAAPANVELGMGLMAGTMLMVACIAAITKLLSAWLSPAQIASGRCVVQTLVRVLLMVATGRGARAPRIERRPPC